MKKANFILAPNLWIHHRPDRHFIGPGMIQLPDQSILMIAPWGRPPTNMMSLKESDTLPPVFKSFDGGRSWQNHGDLILPSKPPGLISDGGIGFLRSKSGKLVFTAHRHVEAYHGGGLPLISSSQDHGVTWEDARLAQPISLQDDVFYMMNDRLIQLHSGRWIIPIACRNSVKDAPYVEGDGCVSRVLYSDDEGQQWFISPASGAAILNGDPRGMAEPAILESKDGSLFLLARTGAGALYKSTSKNAGLTWSKPAATSLTSPCSPLSLYRLPDGRMIVFYNHADPLFPGSFFPRVPLVYATSDDEGESWSDPVLIDNRGQKLDANHRCHIYPSVCFTNEGMVIMYSSHVADPLGQFHDHEPVQPDDVGGYVAILAYPD